MILPKHLQNHQLFIVIVLHTQINVVNYLQSSVCLQTHYDYLNVVYDKTLQKKLCQKKMCVYVKLILHFDRRLHQFVI